MPDVKEMAKPKTNGPQVPSKEASKLSDRDARSASRLARRASTGALRAGNPFAFIRHFAREMDDLIEDFSIGHGLHMPGFLTRGHELLRREAGLADAEWSPHVDVLESNGQFLVRADLPGIARPDIQVELTENAVTIQGERKQEKQEERDGCYYSERSYGRFFRAIPLPEGVDASKATAQFHDGVLEVAMPVQAIPKPQTRRLEIQDKK